MIIKSRGFPCSLICGKYAGRVFGRFLIVINTNKVADATELRSLIKHEETHQAQMSQLGTINYYWKWVTSDEWRLKLEMEGYLISQKFDPRYTDEKIVRLLNSLYDLQETYDFNQIFDAWNKFKEEKKE